MPLQGTFDILDFSEALRLVAGRGLTGRLHVRHRSFAANLFFEDGQLAGADQSEHPTAAAAGDVHGRLEEVCFEMLDAERGNFEFQPGKATTLPGAARYPVEELLASARQRLEEWHALQEVIPSLELQPRLVLDLQQTEVTIDRDHWRLLTAVDGRRNLRAIGRVLGLPDFDICQVVKSLLDDGVIELDGLGALSASSRDAMPVVPAPDGGAWAQVASSTDPPAEGSDPPGETDPEDLVAASMAPVEQPDPVEGVAVLDLTGEPAPAAEPPRTTDDAGTADATGGPDAPEGTPRRGRLIRIRSRHSEAGHG